MTAENFVEEALESGEEVEDGLVWHTYMLQDSVVQIPRESDGWRVDRIKAIYDQLDGNVPTPDIKDSESGEGVLFERVDGKMLRGLKQSIEDAPEGSEEYRELRSRYLKTVESAGKALTHIHGSSPETEGYGYFKTDGDFTETPHETWRAYVEGEIIDRDEVPEEFERAAELAFQNFEIDIVPENPERGILHEDYNAGNIMSREDGSAVILDFDNAIYGDPDFGYINSKMELCDHDDREAHRRFQKGYESV